MTSTKKINKAHQLISPDWTTDSWTSLDAVSSQNETHKTLGHPFLRQKKNLFQTAILAKEKVSSFHFILKKSTKGIEPQLKAYTFLEQGTYPYWSNSKIPHEMCKNTPGNMQIKRLYRKHGIA